jgi:tetratricopeptide (TPR) repeat protein
MQRPYDDDYGRVDFSSVFHHEFEDETVSALLADATIAVLQKNFGPVEKLLSQIESHAEYASALGEPVWAYIALQAGRDGQKDRARQVLRTANADEAACLNDLAVNLADVGEIESARKLMILASRLPSDHRFTLLANVAVCATINPQEFDRTASLEDGKTALDAAIRDLIAKGLPNKPTWDLLLTSFRYLNSLFLLGYQPADVGRILWSVHNILDQVQPYIRDIGSCYLTSQCIAFSKDLLSVNMALEKNKSSVDVLNAVLLYCVSGEGNPKLLHEMDQNISGYICLLIAALILEEEGDADQAFRAYDEVVSRYPQAAMLRARLAGFCFRQGDLDRADREAIQVVRAEPEYFELMRSVADHQQSLLERAVEQGLHERPADQDNYSDPNWAKKAWDAYDFSFRRFSRHQEVGVAINADWVSALENLLSQDPSIASVLNFGVFNGYFDKEIADKYPSVKFTGYDRYSEGIDLSTEAYKAENLSFLSRVSLDSVLEEAVGAGPAVLCHIRTCTTLYPAGVKDLYDRCHDAGIEYILGVEGAGFSFYAQKFISQSDPDRPPTVPLGTMVDHNYVKLLGESGYDVIDRQLRPYPIPFELRAFIGLYNLVTFVARRRGEKT